MWTPVEILGRYIFFFNRTTCRFVTNGVSPSRAKSEYKAIWHNIMSIKYLRHIMSYWY